MLAFNSVVDPETNDHIISNLTEYKFMLYVLSDYDQSVIIDWHLEGAKANGGEGRPEHPITYGDVCLNEEGKEVPRETQLTCPADQGSKMCLDYILQVIPSVQRPGTVPGDPNSKIPIGLKLDGKCSVRQFFVDKETEGQGKVS